MTPVERTEIQALLDCGDYVRAAHLIEKLPDASFERSRLEAELLWRRGDVAALESYVRRTLAQSPDLLSLYLLNLARVYSWKGMHSQILTEICPHIGPRIESDEPATVAALHAKMAFAWFVARELEQSESHARKAIDAFVRAGDRSKANTYWAFVGRIKVSAGSWSQGVALMRQGVEGIDPSKDPIHLSAAALHLSNTLLFRGWFESAEPLIHRVLRLSEEIGREVDSIAATAAHGLLHLRTGRLAMAADLLLDALGRARQHKSKRLEGTICEYLGELALARQRFHSAKRWLRRASDLGKSVTEAAVPIECTMRFAEAELGLARHREALALADRAVSDSTAIGDPYETAVAKRVRAQVRLAMGDWDGAAVDLDSAESFLGTIEERFEAKRVRLLEEALLHRTAVEDIRRLERERGLIAAHVVGYRTVSRATLDPADQGEIDSSQKVRESRARRVAVQAQRPETATHHPDFPNVLGQSPNLLATLEEAKTYASLDCSILIEGETGTGKELIARAIHRLSPRHQGEFVPFNSGTSSPEIFDAEIFGHVRGAFTGAVSNRNGLARTAHHGTLFLDEIAELSKELQPRLLRLLDSGEVRPVGADKSDAVNLRVIAATHRDLLKLSHEGAFRKDLLFRLVTTRVRIPALRDRTGDLEILVSEFVRVEQQRNPEFLGVSDKVLVAMADYEWPGNIRELRNEVTRLAALTRRGVASYWSPTIPRRDEDGRLDPLSRESIEAELRRAKGSVTIAAERLDASRGRIYRLVKEYGIDLRVFRSRP